MSAKLCCLLLLALGPSFVLAYPRFVTGCAQPVSALGPHAAPVQDASISIEITTLPPDFRGVLHSGTSYNLTLSAPSAARGLLIASSGSFASANGCSGRRLNLDAVATNHYATWTAGEEAPTFTVTFASSSTAPYRQHKRVLGEAPPVTPAAAPVVPPASTPVARSAAGSGLGDMAGMGPAAEVPGGSFVESMHVGVLHVDSMHTHDAHMSGGGSWAGHMIPAAFFILWGGYWAISALPPLRLNTLAADVPADVDFAGSIVGVAHAATTLAPFKPRAWYPFLPNTLPLSSRLRRLEPILKVALPSFGAFCELYFHPPHPSFNSMWNAEGRSFNEGHVKFWQHTMSAWVGMKCGFKITDASAEQCTVFSSFLDAWICLERRIFRLLRRWWCCRAHSSARRCCFIFI